MNCANGDITVHQWCAFGNIWCWLWNAGSFMLHTGCDMILLFRNSDDWLSEAAITNSKPRFLLVCTENHTCLLHTNFCCLVTTDAECGIWGQLSNTFVGKLFYFLVFPTKSRFQPLLWIELRLLQWCVLKIWLPVSIPSLPLRLEMRDLSCFWQRLLGFNSNTRLFEN